MIQFLNTLPLPQDASFLDLGCGNGSILLSLREDFPGRALGVDYSPQSIALAKQVASAKDLEDIEFREWDIIGGSYDAVLTDGQKDGWDVVLDKGTFDAISLSEQKEQGRRLCELYPRRVVPLVKKGGVFLVTSCNWTEEELTNWFTGEDAGGAFVVEGRVEYRTFSFGGVKGQTISTLCFRRV